MRSRKEIEKDVEASDQPWQKQVLMLEVLLDIRDILLKKEV